MADLLNDFEGGTNGTTVTTANSGGASGTPAGTVHIGTGAAQTYSTDVAAHGTMSLKFAQPATASGITNYFEWVASNTALHGYARFYLYPTTRTTAFQPIKFQDSTGTTIFELQINASGLLKALNAAGTVIWTSTNPVPLNQFSRIEIELIVSATVGQAIVKLFTTMDSTSPLETSTIAATQNFGSANIDQILFGTSINAANQLFYMDDIGYSEVAALGPAAAPPAFTVTVVESGAETSAKTPPVTVWSAGAEVTAHVDEVVVASPTGPVSALAQSGKTILGLYRSANGITNMESTIAGTTRGDMSGTGGGKITVVKLYADCSTSVNGQFHLNPGVQALAENGAWFHVALGNDFWGAGAKLDPGTTYHPAAVNNVGVFENSWVGFDDIISGIHDAAIHSHAASILQIIAWGGHVIWDIVHEPDLQDPSGLDVADNPQCTPALFPQMVRHYYNTFIGDGVIAAGAEYAWVVSGYQYASQPSIYQTQYGMFDSAGPLDDIVTWIMDDPYISSGSDTVAKWHRFYDFVQGGGLTTIAKSKAFGSGEFGVASALTPRNTWFTPTYPAVVGKLNLMEYFDSQTWTVDGSSDLGAWQAMANQFD